MTPEQEESLTHEIDRLYKKLVVASSIDLTKVSEAIQFGRKAHEGQFRKKGDPYFVHPVRVASKVTEYDLDTNSIISALLHDVVEDTSLGNQEIRTRFGDTVAKIVDALTKVKHSPKLTLYKIFQLGHVDFRVILIKLLDRLDNLQDLNVLGRAKQRRICTETLNVYAGVAHGLGLLEIEEELRELVFQHLYPRSYAKVNESLASIFLERKPGVQRLADLLKKCISPANLISIDPHYHTAQEFLDNRSEIGKVLDSITIQTPDVIRCYQVLGEIHTNLRSVPLAIRDFISNPKANGWRGLTTKVMLDGIQVDIEIVTPQFHAKNRLGLITLIHEGLYQSDAYQDFLQMYVELAESGEEVRIDDVLRRNKTSTIQVLTPAGDVVELRYGASVLDFAFAVHTDLGLHCRGGIIDHIRYPRDKILEDGMVVEVLVDKDQEAKRSWLNMVVMPKSRKEIIKHVSRNLSKEPKPKPKRDFKSS